jgi:hypothetical protein
MSASSQYITLADKRRRPAFHESAQGLDLHQPTCYFSQKSSGVSCLRSGFYNKIIHRWTRTSMSCMFKRLT